MNTATPSPPSRSSSRSIQGQVARAVRRKVEGEVFGYSDFPQSLRETPEALAKALSRLAASGEIVRAAKGLYYRPVKTRFGEAGPSTAQVLEALTRKGRRRTGYVTGPAAWSAMGLTTQIPSIVTVASTAHERSAEVTVAGRRVKLVPARVDTVTRRDTDILRWLDALEKLLDIPDSAPGKTVDAFRDATRRMSAKEHARLATLAASYPPRVRLLAGAVLEDLGEESLALGLLDRRLRRAALGGLDAVLALVLSERASA